MRSLCAIGPSFHRDVHAAHFENLERRWQTRMKDDDRAATELNGGQPFYGATNLLQCAGYALRTMIVRSRGRRPLDDNLVQREIYPNEFS
jgi:hypothetical protein